MPSQVLQTDGFVLLKREPTDTFQSYTVFSPEQGNLLVLQRLSRKATPTSVALDLFDEVSLELESSNQGQTWFVREARLVTRHTTLGRSYDTLRFASRLAALIARNPGDPASRPAVALLLRTALASLAAGARADIVYLKSLYVFARDEGYPLKQEWFPALAGPDQAIASQVLNRPLAEQTASRDEVNALQRRLEHYLNGQTEIIIPE